MAVLQKGLGCYHAALRGDTPTELDLQYLDHGLDSTS